MGLFGGLKKIGRGIGKGIKKGVKGLDKFDDWIKLKEIANIMQFVPGPQQAFFKPLAMTYAGFDVAKGIKNKDIMGAGLAGLQMYGSSKIDTGGLAGRGASSLAPMAGEALPEGIQAAAGQVGGQSLRQAVQSNIGGNLKNYAGGFSAPFKAYAGLDPGSQLAVSTLAPPLMYELSGKGNRQAERLRQAPSYDYQPMNPGQVQGFSPTTQLPTQAQGGITGDDYGPGSLYELDEMMDARDDENRRYWHKKDLEEGIPSSFDRPVEGSPWPAPGISDRPLGPFRDYAGELGLTPWMFDTLLDARIDRENRLRGPSQREMEEIEAEQHGWLPGLTPEEKLQSYQEAVERSKRYEPSDYWQDPTLPKISPLARGGITGDDWHRPINRLPANYEGWVTQPSLATLGEEGKEAVLPLNKLLPAMNKGGLNYSPGQAIVGEAGPEYVTRLGPGEEQYAQSILREQPVPQMQEGSIAGGVARGVGRGVKNFAFPQGWLSSKLLGKGAKYIPGVGFLFELHQGASDASDLYQGRKGGYGWTQEGTEEYGLGDFLEDQMVNLGYASGVGLPLSAAYDWKRGQLNDIKDLLVEFGWMDPYRKYDVSPGTYAMLKAKAEAQPGTQTPAQPGTQTPAQPVPQTPAQTGPRTSVQTVPQTSVQAGNPLEPLVRGEQPGWGAFGFPQGAFESPQDPEGPQSGWGAFGVPQEVSSLQRTPPRERIDLSLLDNENARYWTTGEGSRYAPERLYDMIRDMGYGDTRKQVEEIQRNARDKEKWYRAVTKEAEQLPYPGIPPG